MNTIQLLNNANLRTFQNRYYSNAKYSAQESLAGITHYVDDNTLKFFKAKILRAKPINDGALYMILESSSKDFEHTKRGFRVVVFDVFGDSIYRPALDEMHDTTKQALKAFENWSKSFDVDAYYRERMARKAIQLKKQAERLEEALA
jgi:hypothetical protein